MTDFEKTLDAISTKPIFIIDGVYTIEVYTPLDLSVNNSNLEHFTITSPEGCQDYIDAVLKENIDAPYSCQGGVCSSCIARVTEGEATMVKNQILTDGEIEDGLILTCQAHATTPTLKVDYDDV